ncbi:hypothetical protein [Agarilytica rhodophyticola]|uniref:hypothetical protein n=1 Tax=Agarilytica rhodophyticola TaxID=1737490 RepID=UPI000B344E4B|nr:hypothetical protein [Agarilytica rhodophyticola]
MSTRSTIALKKGDGYYAIYCHHDGHDTGCGVGPTLREYHNSSEDANALIALGSLSYIENNEVYAYHRDHNNPWHRCKPQYANSIEQLIIVAERNDANFLYVYDDNQWQTHKLY